MPLLFYCFATLRKDRWRPAALIVVSIALIASAGAIFYYQPYEDFLGQFQNFDRQCAAGRFATYATSYFILWGCSPLLHRPSRRFLLG